MGQDFIISHRLCFLILV